MRNAVDSASAVSGARGDRARAQHTACRPARSRIDDVAVARAIGDDELLAGAARANRRVAQPDSREQSIAHSFRSTRRNDVHMPAEAAAADRQQAAAPSREQRVRRANLAHAGRHAVECVPLAHRAKIDLESTAAEPHRALRPVEIDGLIADAGSSRCDHIRRRDASIALEKSPAATQGRRCHVEGTVSGAIQLTAAIEQIEELVVDFDRTIGGAAIDVASPRCRLGRCSARSRCDRCR